MPEHTHYDDQDIFNPETHHEQSDVPVRPLWWALAIFIVFGIATYFAILLFYKVLQKAERDRMPPPQTAIARPASADVPQNQPLLQPFPRKEATGQPIAPQGDTPVSDLIHMRRREVEVLTSYGWIDRQHGVVRIPIDKAKSLMAARLAVQGQTGGTVPQSTTAPSAAPGSTVAPSGQPVPNDTGVAPAATTATAGGEQP